MMIDIKTNTTATVGIVRLTAAPGFRNFRIGLNNPARIPNIPPIRKEILIPMITLSRVHPIAIHVDAAYSPNNKDAVNPTVS